MYRLKVFSSITRQAELTLGIVFLLVYLAIFFAFSKQCNPNLIVFAIPALICFGWALGLVGSVLVGLLQIPVQLALFGMVEGSWNELMPEMAWLLTTGLLSCVGVGFLRFRADRRVMAQGSIQKHQAEIEHRAKELALVAEVRDRLARDLAPDTLMLAAVDALQKYDRFDSASAYKPHKNGLALVWAGGHQTLPDSFSGDHFLVAKAVRTASTVFIKLKNQAALGERSLIAVPLLIKGQVWGVLAVTSQLPLEPRDVHLVEEITAHLGLAMDRAQVYANLREQETLYRTMLETLPNGVIVWDGSKVVYMNPVTVQRLGFSQFEEVTGRSLSDFLPEGLLASQTERLQRIWAGQKDSLQETRAIGKNGQIIEIEAQGVLVEIEGKKHILISAKDITEHKRQKARIEFLAYHDPLTGLPNRLKLWELAESWLGSDRRKRDTPALIYLDLDNFKLLNDTLGHTYGDDLLKMVAERIKGELRQEDVLARLGGDEFALLLDSADRNRAIATARRILGVFALPFVLGQHSINVQASLGVALYPEHGITLEQLARAADVAMYHAKTEKNGFFIYDPEQDHNSLERLELIQELRKTIAQGEFLIQYQPILSIADRDVQKWESLVRWIHPIRGLMWPHEFIPLAEESGLIGDLDLAVLRQALRDHRVLDGEITVNFSAVTLAHPNWVREVIKALVDSDMPPSRLWLEITESALLPERQKWLSGLVALRGLGVRIALDDFGMGYSSISHLREVPIDLVKIDKLFTQEIGHNPASEDILRAVIQLAEAFGLKTLAEGVESRQQLEWLAQEGCHFVQGYHVGLPMPSKQAMEESAARVFR